MVSHVIPVSPHANMASVVISSTSAALFLGNSVPVKSCSDTEVSGYRCVRIPRCPDTEVSGYRGVRIPRCPDERGVWMNEVLLQL